MTTTTEAIEVAGITKAYDDTPVLRGIDLGDAVCPYAWAETVLLSQALKRWNPASPPRAGGHCRK